MSDELKLALELFGKREGAIAICGIRMPDLNNRGHELIVVSDNEYYSVKHDDIIEDEGLCGHTSNIWIKANAEVWRCQKTTLQTRDAAVSKISGMESLAAGHASEASLAIQPNTLNLGLTPPSTHTMNLTLTPAHPGAAAAGRKPSYQALQNIVLAEIHTSGATVAWLLGQSQWDDQGKTQGLNYTALQLAETRDNINRHLAAEGYATAPAGSITLRDLNALIKDKTVGDFVNAFATALGVRIPGRS